MSRSFLLFAMTAAAMVVAAPVLAEPAFPEDDCQASDAVYLDATLMQVRQDVPQAHFLDRACATDGACGKQRSSYLVAGDMVLASQPSHGATCVYFAKDGGKVVAGYMREQDLQRAESVRSSPADFFGDWREVYGDTIDFKIDGRGKMSVKGFATYGEGAGTNTGQIEGSPEFHGTNFSVDGEGDCKISGRLRGPYLVVEESAMECGGMNVSFMGLYTKR